MISKIRSDQVADWARRTGMSLTEAELTGTLALKRDGVSRVDVPSALRWGAACLALTANCENQHRVVGFLLAVQSKVASPPARDDPLAQILLGGSSDERMVLKNANRFGNQFYRFERNGSIRVEQEIRQPLKIGQRLSSMDQSRQDLASGLETLTPVARARMQAWTSFAG